MASAAADHVRWRVVGAFLALQMVGLIGPFILLHPLAGPNMLRDAAASQTNLHVAIAWLFLNSSLALLIALSAWPMFRQRASMGLGLVTLGALVFAFQAIDNAHIYGLLSLSQQYVDGSANADLLQAMARTASATRKWVHMSELIAIDAWIALFYATCFVLSIGPRWLTALGLLTVGLHFGALLLPMMLGLSGVPMLGATMALTHFAMAGWLMVKGRRATAGDRTQAPLDKS